VGRITVKGLSLRRMTDPVADATKTLGERLTLAMKRKGVKNPEVAAAAQVVPNTVSKWRNDVQPPDEPQLQRVAAFLGVTVGWLRYGQQIVFDPAPARGGARPDFVVYDEDGRAIIGEVKAGSLPQELLIFAKEFELEAAKMGADEQMLAYVHRALQMPEAVALYGEGYREPANIAAMRKRMEGIIAGLKIMVREYVKDRKAAKRRSPPIEEEPDDNAPVD
jgi:transcriptional regulator with XRE-family HTH domain